MAGKQPSDSARCTRSQTMPSQSAPAVQLQGQLQANQSEITNREQSIAGLKTRINEYQARLNEEPAVEQQTGRSDPRIRSIQGRLRRAC